MDISVSLAFDQLINLATLDMEFARLKGVLRKRGPRHARSFKIKGRRERFANAGRTSSIVSIFEMDQ